MTISLLFFAHYQDVFGERAGAISISDGSTVGMLAEEIERRYPPLSGLLTHGRVAVNEDFADEHHILGEGDCVAWMPPMSGGRGDW